MADITHASNAYDIVIIGAGHNGLTAAAYLAKAGLKVLVVERREMIGGAAATEAVFPGFQVDTGAVDAGLFLPQIAEDLKLANFGLRWLEPPALVFAPQPDGRALTLWRDSERTMQEIARFSQNDARRYPEFLRMVARFAGVLGDMMTITPPALPDLHTDQLFPWLRTALKVKFLGERDMMEFLRLLPMPVDDLLGEWFEDELVKAAIGASGSTGSFLGPKASGTALMLLYQAIGARGAGVRSSRFVEGGVGRLSAALAEAARQRGAQIRTSVDVKRIVLEEGRAVGVELASGEMIRARAVVSSVDPQRTFFDLVGASNLELRTVRDVKNIRLRASLARLNLAVSRLPEFSGAAQNSAIEHLGGHILVAPSLDYIERAYDQAKYGGFSAQPVLDITIPTVNDASLAPPGAHILNINVYYAPYQLAGGDWDAQRDRLQETVIKTLSAYDPELPQSILHSQMLTPLDLERRFSLTSGDIYHGQMGLDQLLISRPIPTAARYRAPVNRLYLCGAGSHPGGGITGAPGYNAAREIMKDLSSS